MSGAKTSTAAKWCAISAEGISKEKAGTTPLSTLPLERKPMTGSEMVNEV